MGIIIYKKPVKKTSIDFEKGKAMKTQEKTEVQERKPFFQRLSVFLKAWHDYFGYRPTEHKLKPLKYYEDQAYLEKGRYIKLDLYDRQLRRYQAGYTWAYARALYKSAKSQRKKAIKKDKALLWSRLKEAWEQL